MDSAEDTELMDQFLKRFSRPSELETAQRRIEELQQQLRQAMDVVTRQATVIRQYRTLLRRAVEQSGPLLSTNPPATTTDPAHSQLGPPPVESTLLPASSSSSVSFVTIPPVPETIPPLPAPGPSPLPSSVPAEFTEDTATKRRRTEWSAGICHGNRMAERCIRLLTSDRADGFPDVALANTIFQTIVRLFNDEPNATFIDEKRIIERCGSLVLGDRPDQPFLNHAKLDRYFRHPFTFQESDQTLVVRMRLIKGVPTWLAFIPEWLKAEWRVAGRSQPNTP